MDKNSLVSVIVPARNSARTLAACLQSIKDQTYKNIELLVIDRDSTDGTKRIAAEFTPHVLNKQPERSTQRNYGVSQATGEYVAIIDSDMVLHPEVIEACVEQMQSQELGGVVIPEESFGEGFWAQCKKLERTFYVGIPWMEAARFFKRSLYLELGGYNENLVSGEDWDFSQRAAAIASLGRIDKFILHDEGRLKLGTTLKKKYYYAQKFTEYLKANKTTQAVQSQTGIFSRYKLFFSKPKQLLRNPVTGLGMLFMKTCEFGVGGAAYLRTKVGKE